MIDLKNLSAKELREMSKQLLEMADEKERPSETLELPLGVVFRWDFYDTISPLKVIGDSWVGKTSVDTLISWLVAHKENDK